MGMGYGGYYFGWYLYKAAVLVIAAFVFSYIFWKTKQLVEKYSEKKKR
ncbi:hypothetical protein J4212_01780 [Candidatus Woesearchaeota archaeon]|nr:hypothetical protein [Candidatus Woesearchaeota archaeon]